MDSLSDTFVTPDWPVADEVQAAATTRRGGVSPPPYDTLNLGDAVGDEPAHVEENRRRVRETLSLPGSPLWLHQVHGADVVEVASAESGIEADGAVTDRPDEVCAILTADCLPVLLADRTGEAVGIAHAGWRGLVAGVVASAVEAMPSEAGDLCAWLGPAISADAYEVGGEVRDALLKRNSEAEACFEPSPNEALTDAGRRRWLADLYGLARRQLRSVGVTSIYGGTFCTYEDEERFYSYRRDGQTGRMASLIWLEASNR